MARGRKGTSDLNTLTRAVAGVVRTEDQATGRAAIRVLLRAYHDEDQAAGRDCPPECSFTHAPKPSDSGADRG